MHLQSGTDVLLRQGSFYASLDLCCYQLHSEDLLLKMSALHDCRVQAALVIDQAFYLLVQVEVVFGKELFKVKKELFQVIGGLNFYQKTLRLNRCLYLRCILNK